MVKKVLFIALGLMLASGAKADWEQAFNPTVAQSDIQFWTGTGSNRAVIAITWVDDTYGNIGIAWGVQWNSDTLILRDLMDTIATYDPRMSITWNSTHTYINNMAYNDPQLGYDFAGEVDPDMGFAWFMYGWKDANEGVKQSGGIMADTIASGDFIDWTLMDSVTYEAILADTMIMATDPNVPVLPEESTIDASEIVYWVGNGNNKVVLAVNWADTALAWGYKFSTDSVLVEDMMFAIAAADSRFFVDTAYGYLSDIRFVLAEGDTLRGASYYWESKRNGYMDAGMNQMLGNGDFEKWCDPTAGVVVDSMEYQGVWYYTYVYPMEINPVSVPVGIASVEAVSVMVWPNPTTSFVNVSVSRPMQAELYDLSGRQVAAYSFAEGSNKIDLSVLQNGVYMLRAEGSVSKIVKR